MYRSKFLIVLGLLSLNTPANANPDALEGLLKAGGDGGPIHGPTFSTVSIPVSAPRGIRYGDAAQVLTECYSTGSSDRSHSSFMKEQILRQIVPGKDLSQFRFSDYVQKRQNGEKDKFNGGAGQIEMKWLSLANKASLSDYNYVFLSEENGGLTLDFNENLRDFLSLKRNRWNSGDVRITLKVPHLPYIAYKSASKDLAFDKWGRFQSDLTVIYAPSVAVPRLTESGDQDADIYFVGPDGPKPLGASVNFSEVVECIQAGIQRVRLP